MRVSVSTHKTFVFKSVQFISCWSYPQGQKKNWISNKAKKLCLSVTQLWIVIRLAYQCQLAAGMWNPDNYIVAAKTATTNNSPVFFHFIIVSANKCKMEFCKVGSKTEKNMGQTSVYDLQFLLKNQIKIKGTLFRSKLQTFSTLTASAFWTCYMHCKAKSFLVID